MSIEINEQKSGDWDVHFEPNIPDLTVVRYRKMLSFLSAEVITRPSFDLLRLDQRACVDVTNTFALPLNIVLADDFLFDNRAIIQFHKRLVSHLTNTLQSGQSVITIRENPGDIHFCVMDPACYLYDIPYEKMPVIIGQKKFIESVASKLYSSAIGEQVNAEYMSPKHSP